MTSLKRFDDITDGNMHRKKRSKSNEPQQVDKQQQADLNARNADDRFGHHAGIEKPKNAGKTPYQALQAAIEQHSGEEPVPGNVVFWVRMHDLRIRDNRALEAASRFAREHDKALIVLHVLSPQDYKLHDRSPRRIDFVLRQLKSMQKSLLDLNIPLIVRTVEKRKDVPEVVLDFCKDVHASLLTANIEYEVDELRRDIRVFDQTEDRNIVFKCFHDIFVVEPGVLLTKDKRPYSVFSHFSRSWETQVCSNYKYLRESTVPQENSKQATANVPAIAALFKEEVPSSVAGFECSDRELMEKLYLVGEDAASMVLDKFLYTAANKRVDQPPLDSYNTDGSVNIKDKKSIHDKSSSRISKYSTDRDRVDFNSSSRLSPYLAAGLISVRECVRRVMPLTKGKPSIERGIGASTWTNEIVWRDFYGHVLAMFPHVSMRQPFQRHFAKIEWEDNSDGLEAWKKGQTGYPIVDASMRQLTTIGYMHNRCRMIVAMFLTKDLLIDWHEGERFFMQNLIDGDLASNNGGWQWSASTGSDPQPYFRVFNPLLQSQKADPNGDFIRKWVPELRKLTKDNIHEPSAKLSKNEFEKLNYPKPIIDHFRAKERCLERFKQVVSNQKSR